MDPLDALLALEHLGIKFGLENIRALCSALGNPQQRYPSLIVAGTNGKGSVAAMIDRALTAAGHRSGRYTSPHLIRLEERIAIDGVPIATDTLRRIAGDVLLLRDRLRIEGALVTDPTFFEVCTAIAFEAFKEAAVNVAVLEVGMGGRFDATNVAQPLAGAITTIDFDHERFLGRTIREIAFEKAGVIKPGMIVVVGESKPEALEVVSTRCRNQGARLVAAGEGVRSAVTISEGRTLLELRTPTRSYPPMLLALRGRHQALNALVAARLLETLSPLGLDVPPAAVVEGLTRVRWRGRLELVRLSESRQVLFDAAHNPAGARVLAEYLEETYPQRLPIVFGAMRDKDAATMLAILARRASCFVFTQPPNARAAAPEAIARLAAAMTESVPVALAPDPADALATAFESGPLVVVAGSIFLVGDLLARVAAA
jgi:dihydrofolate synthase/folylpolyglutamate synthase